MKLSIPLLLLAVASTLAFVGGASAFVVPAAPSSAPPSSSIATTTALSSSLEGVDVSAGERQKLYGVSVDMPDTYVRCGRCGAAYALQADDLGDRGKGRRVECSVCSHSWFQSRDRLFTLRDGFELSDFPPSHLDRIAKNIAAGRSPDFVGDAKLYVGNLDYNCGEEELTEHFSAVGDVGEVSVITDDTGRSRGFAFVTMFTKEDGKKALELDQSEVMGRKINVRPPNN